MRGGLTERDMQSGIIEAAQRGGWLVAHFHDSRRQVTRKDGTTLWIGDKDAAGFPDLVIVRPPEVMVLELKVPGGRVSPKQKEWIEALQDCAVITAGVVRPAGYAAALRHLARPSRRAERVSRALREIEHGQ